MTIDISSMTDRELSELAAEIAVEQQERGIAAADPQALIELGFQTGFDSKGMPLPPVLEGGVLVCFGARVDKSATSHDCAFVSFDGTWVWEHDDLMEEEIRNPAAARPQMRSVSLVPVYDGMKLDFVRSEARTGIHKMKKVLSYEVQNGKLVHVQSRAAKSASNR